MQYSKEEIKRNTYGITKIFAHSSLIQANTIDPKLGITGSIKDYSEGIKVGDKLTYSDKRLALEENIVNTVVCYEYLNPSYIKHVTKVFSSAVIPPRTIILKDIMQADKRRPAELLAVKLTEKLMGTDKDAPEFVTTYVNLRNQPHQRSYMDDHDRGIASGPMIYKTWRGPNRGTTRFPPGPLNLQYNSHPINLYATPSRYIHNPRPSIQVRKRAYPGETEEIQQPNKRLKKGDEKLADVKAALEDFFNSKKE